MNTLQRVALAAIAVGALVMLLYPPFYMRYSNGVVTNLGYHFLFDPPYRFISRTEITAFVHVPTLLVQLLGLLIVGGSAWLLAGAFRSRTGQPIAAKTQPAPPASTDQKRKFDPSRVAGSEGDRKTPHRGAAIRVTKRVGITVLAFLASGVLIALWTEYIPGGSLSGAIMAVAAVGLVLGAWRWSASFK